MFPNLLCPAHMHVRVLSWLLWIISFSPLRFPKAINVSNVVTTTAEEGSSRDLESPLSTKRCVNHSARKDQTRSLAALQCAHMQCKSTHVHRVLCCRLSVRHGVMSCRQADRRRLALFIDEAFPWFSTTVSSLMTAAFVARGPRDTDTCQRICMGRSIVYSSTPPSSAAPCKPTVFPSPRANVPLYILLAQARRAANHYF